MLHHENMCLSGLQNKRSKTEQAIVFPVLNALWCTPLSFEKFAYWSDVSAVSIHDKQAVYQTNDPVLPFSLFIKYSKKSLCLALLYFFHD